MNDIYEVSSYEDTIRPFDAIAARFFVWQHENIFAKSTRRYIEYVGEEIIIIKEVTTSPDGIKQYWYWVFFPTVRYIVKAYRKLPLSEVFGAIEEVKE